MRIPITPLIPGIISVLIVLLLPLTGIILNGNEISYYLQLPPAAGYTVHAPFSLPVFIVLTSAFLILISHPVFHIIRSRNTVTPVYRNNIKFPLWGWCGLILCAAAWFIAWTRIPVFMPVQRFTFLPLWLAYILIINALCLWRTGSSLITHSTRYMAVLFPLSAIFWWIFEYLNRFTTNWYYTGSAELSVCRYIIEASLAFSTVLPAVMSTGELLKSFPKLYAGMDNYLKINIKNSRSSALALLFIAGSGLAFTGIFPEILFPLLWVSPLLILTSITSLSGCGTVFSGIKNGDWRPVIIYSLSALICGFFWEMWNINCLAKWIYSIPYVNGLKIFEMPMPGYAGYLPFGLECAVVAGFAGRLNKVQSADPNSIQSKRKKNS
ncbi:MAG TPA: hypothetical protein PK514_13885 [Spirochaetota bacterium]|nr:hypothetical protein [Spirochaetota bacterium]